MCQNPSIRSGKARGVAARMIAHRTTQCHNALCFSLYAKEGQLTCQVEIYHNKVDETDDTP